MQLSLKQKLDRFRIFAALRQTANRKQQVQLQYWQSNATIHKGLSHYCRITCSWDDQLQSTMQLCSCCRWDLQPASSLCLVWHCKHQWRQPQQRMSSRNKRLCNTSPSMQSAIGILCFKGQPTPCKELLGLQPLSTLPLQVLNLKAPTAPHHFTDPPPRSKESLSAVCFKSNRAKVITANKGMQCGKACLALHRTNLYANKHCCETCFSGPRLLFI
jgi:hypothetical protein